MLFLIEREREREKENVLSNFQIGNFLNMYIVGKIKSLVWNRFWCANESYIEGVRLEEDWLRHSIYKQTSFAVRQRERESIISS